MVRRDGTLVSVSWGEALDVAAHILRDAASSPDGVGAIGGAALTNEGAFAWERFVRGVLGSEHVDAQYGDGLDAALLQSLPKATIDEAANAKTVVTLTGDLREELPILFLRLRESAVAKHHNIVELAFGASALRSVAKLSLPVRPGEAHLVAQALTGGTVAKGLAFGESELAQARELIGEGGEGVVFVVGRPNLAESAKVVETAIRLLVEGFPGATFLTALRRANVNGALDMGLAPQLRPGRGFDASVAGRDTPAQLEAMVSGDQKAVVLLGGCLLGNVTDLALATKALEAAKVVVVSGHGGQSLAYADVVLPAAVQHERTGTVTNIEGRVTSVTAKISAPGSAWSDVAIASELAEEFGQSLGLSSIEATAKAIEETTGYPALSVLNDGSSDGVMVGRDDTVVNRRPLDPMAFPGIRSAYGVGLASRIGSTDATGVGSMTSTTGATLSELSRGQSVEVPLADAYSLRVNVSRRLYDRGIAMQGSPALLNLVETISLGLNHFDLDRLGVATGDVVLVSGTNGTVSLPVVLDNGVPRGTVEIAFGTLSSQGENVLGIFLDGTSVINQVRLETL
jgi:NADH-quinone oxidoreductase subunit G